MAARHGDPTNDANRPPAHPTPQLDKMIVRKNADTVLVGQGEYLNDASGPPTHPTPQLDILQNADYSLTASCCSTN